MKNKMAMESTDILQGISMKENERFYFIMIMIFYCYFIIKYCLVKSKIKFINKNFFFSGYFFFNMI